MDFGKILSISLNFVCLLGTVDCNKIYRNYTENFYNLAVTSGDVFVGGNHSLIKLNSSLHEVKVIPLSGRNLLLTPFQVNGGTIIVSCTPMYDSTVSMYRMPFSGFNTETMKPVDEYSRSVITVNKLSTRYITNVIEETDEVGYSLTITASSLGCFQDQDVSLDECLAISNYENKLDNKGSHNVRYLVDKNGNVDLNGVVLDFKSVAVHKQFTYFLFQLNNRISKLGKLCNKSPLDISYEDLPIYCTHNGVNYTIAQDMVFWNDYLLVTFTYGVRSVICKFTDLSESYKTSRKDKLKCPNRVTVNQYFKKPMNFDVCYNLTSGNCDRIGCPQVNQDFCSSKLFGTVEGDIPMKGVAIYHTQNTGTITKMTDLLLADKFAVLYVGTSRGFVGKIFINKSVAFSHGFKEVQRYSPVIDIKKDDKNEGNAYAMTKNQVVNVANNEDCIGNTCEECMKSKNLRCGWDIINKRCDIKFKNPFWVPSAGKACLRIVAEDSILNDDFSEDSTESVQIKFKLVPVILLTALKYKTSGKNLSDVNKTGDYYRTGYINVFRLDPINLEITDMNGTRIASTDVNLYQCKSANSCISCVKDRECFWCPLKHQCVRNSSACVAKEIKSRINCPRVDEAKKVLLAKGETEDIKVSALKLDVFENRTISCEVGGKNYGSTVDSGGNTVVCHDVMTTRSDLPVRLQYNNRNLDGSAELEIYDCRDFGKPDGNCGNCRYQSRFGYKCQWCGTCKYSGDHKPGNCNSQNCKRSVKSVSPLTGPEFGGTSLTITGSNIGNPNDDITVELYGVKCSDIQVLKPSTVLTCMAGNFSTASKSKTSLVITVNGEASQSVAANRFYKYISSPTINLRSFSPNKSIKAGGRKITIKGDNIGFDISNTYQVSFCTSDSSVCVNCSDVKVRGKGTLMCRIDRSESSTTPLTQLKVIIDSETVLIVHQKFTFVGNPNITALDPGEARVFRSGGAQITFKGFGFSDVGEVRIENVDSPCDIMSNKIVKCKSPPYVQSDFERRKRSVGQNININFDNYQVQSTIYYVDDPTFELLEPYTLEYEKEKKIVISGNNLLDGASQEDYEIHIGLDGRCLIQNQMTDYNITCLPPKDLPRTNHSDKNTVYVMVVVGRIRVTVGHLKYITPLPVTIIIIAVLATALVLAVTIGILTTMIQKRRKKKAEENFQMELQTREENIRQASREEFADAQMTIRDIKSDLVTSRVPFYDYQTYIFNQLFPNQYMETHPLLHEPMITDDNRSKVQRAMGMFDKLMNNKLFLKELVQTLDHQSRLTMKDKAQFASLLSVAFMGNMRLFYELVSCLLNEMVQSANKRQYKVLFRRVESIAQRLMVNWLELTLYDHLKNQSGMQLFMLYKATQIVIEKGPIDAVTQNSRNTLAEERLLKNRVEYDTMTLNIDLNGNSDQRFPVSVLNCDTITQVKQKCIIAIYKNKPASEVPTPDELELEWHQGRGGKLTLQDIDNISDRNNGMLRLNTLKHYMVKDGSEMALMYKESADDDPDELYENQQNLLLAKPDHVKLVIEDGDHGMHRWHLSNLTDEEKSDKEHEIGELFLNRLFHTKLLLRDYIDAAFDEMMDPQSLSVPVRYFLCMIDKLGKGVGVDNEILQSWKSECYATRVWASLISKPQILFDVSVPSHVEPCMDILRQVLIDSFTQGTQTVSKDSSTQKLLFYKDVPEYRKRVNAFFLRVEEVQDQDFWRAIDGISNIQINEVKFSRQATLHQLYSFIAKYKDEILEDFADKDEAQNLEFGKKLEEIIDLMDETAEICYQRS